MSNTLVVDTSLQATQQAADFSVLGFKSILPTSTNTPEELTIDTFRDGVRPLLLANPLVDLFAPGNAEKFLTNGTLTTDRATIGTFIDKTDGLLKTAAIDTIREEAEGFLIEGASTNLLQQSEDFTTTWGSPGSRGGATSDQSISPDGNVTADEYEVLINAVENSIEQTSIVISAGSTITLSIYFKNISASNIHIFSSNGSATNGARQWYNPATGTFGSDTSFGSGWSVISARSKPAANGFTRLIVTVATAVDTSAKFRFSISNADGNVNGTLGERAFIWGAQLEKLPFASSYIKTTTTAVTRAAEDVSFLFAGNHPDLTGLTEEFSYLVTASPFGIFNSQAVMAPPGGDFNFSLIRLELNGSYKYFRGGAGITDGVDRSGISTKLAVTVKPDDTKLYADGVEIASGNQTPTFNGGNPTRFNIGSGQASGSFYGHFSDVMIFERALNQLEIVTVQSGAALPATNSSEEDPLFPFVNTLDFRDNTKYSPLVTSGTVVIEFNQSIATTIDYFAFAIHNSQDAGLTGKLEIDEGSGFVVVAEFSGVKNNRPFLKFFGAKNTQRQRLTLNFTSKLFIGTIYLGEAVVFNRTPSLGFQPARFSSLDKVEQFTTDSGNNFIIGRRINKGFQSKGTFRFVNFDDIEVIWEDFANHVLDSKPIFFQWSQVKDQTVFGLQPPNLLHKPSYVTSHHSDISFTINGYS